MSPPRLPDTRGTAPPSSRSQQVAPLGVLLGADVTAGEPFDEYAQRRVVASRRRLRALAAWTGRADRVDDYRRDQAPEHQHHEAHGDPPARTPAPIPVVHHGDHLRPPASVTTSPLR